MLTKSRTAILATGGGIVLLAIYGRAAPSRLAGWISWKLLAGAAAVVVLLALVVVGLGGLDLQVLSEAPLSIRYRLEYWRATAAMIADHPLLGCGPGNFQEHYARYKLPQASETVGDPHNFLLEIWATAGTPALLALLAMAAAFVWQLANSMREQQSQERHGGRPYRALRKDRTVPGFMAAHWPACCWPIPWGCSSAIRRPKCRPAYRCR